MTDDELEQLASQRAEETEHEFIRRTRTMEDFRYDETQEKYWDITTGLLLGPKSVDGAIPRDLWPTREDQRSGELRPYKPSIAINDVETGLTVEGSTWWPGKPLMIYDMVVTDRGAIETKGAVTYNRYIPPDHSKLKTNRNPDKWIEHVKFLFPDPLEHEHFFDYAAHMLQHPEEKVNHGIVISGKQGVGKDTMLLPLRKGVGEWNAAEVGPDALTKEYNPFAKSVMLVVNEVRPHDEDHKASAFYEMCKTVLAAPPDLTPMHVKYANVVYVRNVCHTFLTTNDVLRMYIPREDRRLFVMHSPLPDPKQTPIFSPRYFQDFYEYLADGGTDAVVRWLLNRSLTKFNPGEPPPMTETKSLIIESSGLVRHSFADDIIEQYIHDFMGKKRPKVIFAADFFQFIKESDLFDDASAAKKAVSAKNFHFKMDEHGYDAKRNPDGNEWRNGKFRSRVAFVDKEVPPKDRLKVILAELYKRPLVFKVE